MKTAFYFGYQSTGGHFLSDCEGQWALHSRNFNMPDGFPPVWDKLMDAMFLQNHNVPDNPDGRVFWTCSSTGWFAFHWWDRSGDKRPNSNSGFFVHDSEFVELKGLRHKLIFSLAQESFIFACKTYPLVMQRQKFPLQLVT